MTRDQLGRRRIETIKFLAEKVRTETDRLIDDCFKQDINWPERAAINLHEMKRLAEMACHLAPGKLDGMSMEEVEAFFERAETGPTLESLQS